MLAMDTPQTDTILWKTESSEAYSTNRFECSSDCVLRLDIQQRRLFHVVLMEALMSSVGPRSLV